MPLFLAIAYIKNSYVYRYTPPTATTRRCVVLVRGGFNACLAALKDIKGNKGSDLLWFVG